MSKYENDWHKAYCDCRDELEELKLKLRKEFASFEVLCNECHGTREVYVSDLDRSHYKRCGKCKGSGINKNVSFDLRDKVIIEVTKDEADWIFRDMSGLMGACETEELNEVYRTVAGQIRKQLEK